MRIFAAQLSILQFDQAENRLVILHLAIFFPLHARNYSIFKGDFMNSYVTPSVVQMESKAFELLVAEVKETIADMDLPKDERSFGIVDIWNIRKQGRTAGDLLNR
jgi:hypothetical protein